MPADSHSVAAVKAAPALVATQPKIPSNANGTSENSVAPAGGTHGSSASQGTDRHFNGSQPAPEGSAPANKASSNVSRGPTIGHEQKPSLNDRLKSLDVSTDVDYRPKRVAIGNAQQVLDAALNAYEQRLAPPLEILRQTFGFIYERRTAGHPDSLAYVYESYKIGPLTMCKAYKIVEHPYQVVREVGAVAGSAGIGGAVATNANSPVLRHDNGGAAEVETVQFPCTSTSYTAVPRGSVTTPLPRHPDLLASPAPASSATPAAPPSLAP